VSDSDGSTINIDLGGINVHDLLGRSDDDGESLVELEKSDIILRDPGLLEGLGDGEGGGGREIDRGRSGIGVSYRRPSR
jgi:hypothetical protein